jgi:putative glycosyltransferase (TIGR04372 family)
MRKDQSLMIDVHRTPPLYTFDHSELKQGERFLAELGIPVGAKIVCCVFRDHGYDKSQNDPNYKFKQGYRVTPLENFMPVVTELISLGYYVIRMGRHNSEKLHLNHPKYFDRTEWKFGNDDFLDIFLFGVSEFTVSTGSGIDAFSSFFRKPVLFLNCSTISDLPHTKLWKVALIPDFIREPLNERLPLKSLLDDRISRAWPPHLHSEGIRIMPKSSNDLVNALRIFMKQHGYSNPSLPNSSNYETLENLLY